jgi:gliding motility-associated-like protein
MKYLVALLLFFTAYMAVAQKEANNWLFGSRAGITFLDDGSVQIFSGSQMSTNEGCSSMSDSNGNLLFYTDGRTVWDRNHMVMPNGNYMGGTGLLGDPSSTLSGIIVPKKGDPNIYYIFTVDEPHQLNADAYPAQYTGPYDDGGSGNSFMDDDGFNNGLNYSVVDLSVTGTNGSIGDVTTSNVPLLTYDPNIIEQAKYKCSEKITAVKNQSGTGYWVVAHFIDKFYSFFVDQSGVNSTPVITQLAPVVPTSGYRRNAIGCFKASPDGDYLAIAHQQLGTVTGGSSTDGCIYLYDFNNQNGTVSNPKLVQGNINPYGIEFSPQTKKLYASIDNEIMQYNLQSADIPASAISIASATGTALQLGPNGKIYKAVNGTPRLDVINAPEEDGAACDFVSGGVTLESGTYGIFGLPPFITSLFSAAISFQQNCLGSATQFSLAVNNSFDTVSWNFGDGSPASALAAPQHTYAGVGTYNVVATITRQGDVSTVTRDVVIYAQPVANPTPNMVACDPNNDGFESFTLSNANATILGTQNAATFSIRYFTSQADADANTATPLNASAYTNTANTQTIWARVQNNGNTLCYAITSFSLVVSDTPTVGASTFSICDDAADGADTNGKADFNLSTFTSQWVQSPGFTTTYYATQAQAQAPVNPLPATYYNTIAGTQTIYARIVNNTHTTCITIIPVTLTVNALPNNVLNGVLVQCDTGFAPDGFTTFNLAQADIQYTNGNTALAVTYFNNDADAQTGTNTITGPFTNTANPQTISARVTNSATECYRILPLELHVTANVFAAATLERCDDDGTIDGMAEFDLTLPGFQTAGTTVVYYGNMPDALLEVNAIPTLYTNQVAGQQSVFGRIEENNECMAIRELILIVRPVPAIDVTDTGVVCLNTKAFITLDSGISANPLHYTYAWSTGADTRSIMVNEPGIYTVTVTDITHATLCSTLRTITVVPSNIAQIDNIVVEDLRDNNSITIFASPVGGVNTTYTFSLDAPNGPWQESPYFENVAPGIHTLYINDVNGCGVVQDEVAVLAIPRYFTPNNDGTNDYWHITGINGSNYNQSKIYIFDRYGKFLSDIEATGRGWDGTHDGHDMPSTDYWFVLHLEDGRTVKGHFAMIR